jgi:hypothetical protein
MKTILRTDEHVCERWGHDGYRSLRATSQRLFSSAPFSKCANTVGPSSSMCSLNRVQGPAWPASFEVFPCVPPGITPQIVVVQFDQVEGIEENTFISAVVTAAIERGNAVVIAGDRLSIEHGLVSRRRQIKSVPRRPAGRHPPGPINLLSPPLAAIESTGIEPSNPIGSTMLNNEAGGTIRAHVHGYFSPKEETRLWALDRVSLG